MTVGVSYRNANQKQQQVEKLVYNNSFLDYNRKQRKKRFMIKVKRKLKLRVCELERIKDEFLNTQHTMFDDLNLEMLWSVMVRLKDGGGNEQY